MIRTPLRAILLDFFGTLVEEDHTIIANICSEIAAASSINVSFQEVASRWSGRFHQLLNHCYMNRFRLLRKLECCMLQELLDHFEAPLDARILSEKLFSCWLKPQLWPETRDVLNRCRVPICIVSNIDKDYLASALDYNSLSFEHIVTSEDCKAYKPHSEPFLRALDKLHVKPHEALHIGDSLRSDIVGAKTLGIPALWINRNGTSTMSEQYKPDFQAKDLTALLDIVEGNGQIHRT